MVIKQRAISDEQKQTRRQAILDAALERFRATSYDAVNVAEVAEKAGIAKGTVYLYFNTKEELFLSLQSQEFEAWFDEIRTRLREAQAAPSPPTIKEVAELIAGSLKNRAVLIRLVAILHTVLERNVDLPTAVSFKRMLRSRVLETGALLEACLPFLDPGAGARLLLRIYALVIGLQHLAEPTPVVRQALDKQDLEIFKIDFHDEFTTTVQALLEGIYEQRRK